VENKLFEFLFIFNLFELFYSNNKTIYVKKANKAGDIFGSSEYFSYNVNN